MSSLHFLESAPADFLWNLGCVYGSLLWLSSGSESRPFKSSCRPHSSSILAVPTLHDTPATASCLRILWSTHFSHLGIWLSARLLHVFSPAKLVCSQRVHVVPEIDAFFPRRVSSHLHMDSCSALSGQLQVFGRCRRLLPGIFCRFLAGRTQC